MTKAKYIVIDTVNWKKLVSAIEVERNLSILLHLATSGQLKFLLPVSIKEEWEKHRKVEKNKLQNAVTNHLRKMKLLNISEDDELNRKEAALSLLETQITTIDDILRMSIPLPEEERAIAIIHKHQRTAKETEKSKRLPPFHNKQDSTNDAITIFTTLDYLDKNGITELYFISENHNDFGSPLNPENEIHPGIISVFPTIKIRYFSQISSAITAFELAGLKLKEFKRVLGPRINNNIILDKTQHLINQLHDYLEKRFKELYVLPKHLFLNHYPFYKGTSPLYHSPFTIYTDNENLYDLLSLPYTGSDLTEDLEEKRKGIIHGLWNNQLYHLGKDMLNRKTIDIDYTNEKECSCLLCLYRRLDFLAITESLSNPVLPDKAEELARIAFIQYVMGRHKDTANTLKILESKEGISNILAFLTKYNLATIGRMLDYYAEQTPETKTMIESMLEIDLQQAFDLLKNSSNIDVLKWIHESKFYNETLHEVRECTFKIRDLYENKSSGSHDATLELLEWFLGFSDFIHQNGVLFDIGAHSDPLASAFIEGIFASLRCEPRMSGKLEGFTNRIVEHIILNVHPEIIYKYSKRYKISSIKPFEPLTKFGTMWRRLFEQFSKVQDAIIADDSNRIFRDRYERLTYSTVAVFSILETTESETEEFCKLVIEVFRSQKIFHNYKATTALLFLIDKKKSVLSTATLQSFLDLWIKAPSVFSSQLLNLLVDILEERCEVFLFPADQFDLIKKYCFESDGDNNKDQRWDCLCELFRIFKEGEQKETIRGFVHDSLAKDFNGGNYYEATIYEVINPNEKFNEQYLIYIEAILKEEKRIHGWFGNAYFHDRRVDQFFNYYFKFKVELPDHLGERLKGFDPYYDWLLDMEKFDYSKFNPLWLRNHFSYHYKLQYRKSRKLKSFLQSYIKEHFEDLEAQRVFMFTYGYDD